MSEHNEVMFVAPAHGTSGMPYVRMGDVLIFTYWGDDGKVCVTVDTEDCDENQPRIRFNVNNGTMWEGVPGS